ncbi:hypothetical protein Hdeb2414_s0092g00789021 [Helianthus debilis subsp. tardiflorus]
MTDHWLQSALTNDVLVAELLLRAKHSTDSDSSRRHPPSPTTSTAITTILPPLWGHRKNRSKSISQTTAGKEHRRSPTTHLSWSVGSGGAGGCSSDGYDESCRPSDLSSGGRSIKVNEVASTSSHHKSEKRKVFQHEQELTSIRVPLYQQISTSENLKRIKIDLDQNQRNKTRVMEEHKRQIKSSSMVSQSCRVEAETVAPQKGFVLPDLNMTPSEEDLAMMS